MRKPRSHLFAGSDDQGSRGLGVAGGGDGSGSGGVGVGEELEGGVGVGEELEGSSSTLSPPPFRSLLILVPSYVVMSLIFQSYSPSFRKVNVARPIQFNSIQ